MSSDVQRAAAGKVVQIHYILRGEIGEELDSSAGGEPLEYLHGASNIIPGLEKAITGHAPGDHVDIAVAPADGYGERDRPSRQPVPRTAFPPAVQLRPGMRFATEDEDGGTIPVWVVEVTEEAVFLDFNHPLAGTTLHFAVDVVSIRDASAEEMEHGHPHGPGGHHHH